MREILIRRGDEGSAGIYADCTARGDIAWQPMNLKAIARDAALRGDTKTLFHALDLLEPVMPIATFMDFCTELEEIRLQGVRPRPHAPAVKRFPM